MLCAWYESTFYAHSHKNKVLVRCVERTLATLPSPLPLVVAISTTGTTSGHLWLCIAGLVSISRVAPCIESIIFWAASVSLVQRTCRCSEYHGSDDGE